MCLCVGFFQLLCLNGFTALKSSYGDYNYSHIYFIAVILIRDYLNTHFLYKLLNFKNC